MARPRYYKTLFIGDILGQHKIWKNSLLPIVSKVDEVVQMGNIIGLNDVVKDIGERGGNNALMKYVLLWRASSSNWTQLIGQNEIMALNFPDYWTGTSTNKMLRKRWLDKDEASYKTAGVNKGRLVTHGGLTHGLWKEIGEPETAEKAAEILCEMYDGNLYFGKSFRLNGTPNFSADPVFADPLYELYPSWLSNLDEIPFGQIHSSGGLNTKRGYEAMGSPYSLVNYVDSVKHTNYGSIVSIKNANFISVVPDIPIDKKLTSYPRPWEVYIEKMPVVDTREEMFD